ncbi:hypothetical protein ACFPN2_35790 [Steroidobacter flavus]|uniref:GIY-YIG domain-containing protein n=1 Tax=Steroidobacter flavus TaxID=1842136 RepID=A0ABV8T7K8_9GAMM
MNSAPARLNADLIQQVIQSFPCDGGWQELACSILRPDRAAKRSWTSVSAELSGQAGLYAFLFPRTQFSRTFTFELDGPAKRKIPFGFCVEDLPVVAKDYFVAYVGRSANLLQRLQWHFQSWEESTAAQVRKALIRCGYVRSVEEAVDFMIQHGKVVYRRMPGDENVANRDIIEVALWATYRCPFNIKSER